MYLKNLMPILTKFYSMDIPEESQHKEVSLFEDVFCLPYKDKYIIYFPLKNVILLGNAKLINLLYKARLGNKSALNELGINSALVAKLFESATEASHLKKRQEIEPFTPTTVTLFLTNDCTLRCQYCYANGGKNTKNMPWNIITGIIDQIVMNARSSLNPITVHFHGGGDVGAAWPLLIQTFQYLSMQSKIYDIPFKTSLGSNGFLNEEQRRWIIKNINWATISIDGPPEIQNFHRPTLNKGPSFPLVYETLKTFDLAEYSYSIRTTVTAQTVNKLPEIVSFFAKILKQKKLNLNQCFQKDVGY